MIETLSCIAIVLIGVLLLWRYVIVPIEVWDDRCIRAEVRERMDEAERRRPG